MLASRSSDLSDLQPHAPNTASNPTEHTIAINTYTSSPAMDLLRRLFSSGAAKGGKAPKWSKETVNQEVLNARLVSKSRLSCVRPRLSGSRG